MAQAEAPLSAIDWLNDPVPNPLTLSPDLVEPEVTQTALTPDISVTPLGEIQSDAVGLLPPKMTGLPLDLWQHSATDDLVDLIEAQSVKTLPAMQALFYTLMLAEAEAPGDSDQRNRLLTARLDALLDLGAVEAVQAILDRANPATPDLFARWFQATLLTGDEDRACLQLMQTPRLAPSYAARVFCTARSGDWSTAALILETGRALDLINTQELALLQHFLDPELFEGEPLPHPPVRPSSLVFRLREAVGEPMATAPLPRPFAVADLRGNTGWKAKIEAAERLAQTGALAENRLLGIYSERSPAASGGLWDRVDAVQKLDVALRTGDTDAVEVTLPKAFVAIKVARLEVPFAKLFAEPLSLIPLAGQAAEMAYRLALLSSEYETAAQIQGEDHPNMAFLTALARGAPQEIAAKTEVEKAIQDGFAQTTLPDIFAQDAADRRLGEIILRAMTLYQRAVEGETNQLATALATLRSVGLEDAARQSALQILLLDRGV
ncbi:MAG: hypothetical protein JXR13_06090 [Thalassovita sp.]